MATDTHAFETIFYASVYMICSTGIIFTNKLVLTSYKFPSFLMLAFAQTLFTFVLVHVFFKSKISKAPITETVYKVAPLSLFYALDMVMGIAGTGSLSLPLFSAMRRLSNFLILVGEHFLLGTKRSLSVYGSVSLMVLGAIVAALGDIAFDPLGYMYVSINNLSTAGKALLTKSRLQDLGFSSIELLYYNSGFMVPVIGLLALWRTDLRDLIHFPYWGDSVFLVCFLFSCCSAVLLNYSLLQCTHYTSALTTSIIGVTKNVVVTYVGMFVGGDYVFTPLNFTGVTVSAAGAVIYGLVTYMQQKSNTNGDLPKPENPPSEESVKKVLPAK